MRKLSDISAMNSTTDAIPQHFAGFGYSLVKICLMAGLFVFGGIDVSAQEMTSGEAPPFIPDYTETQTVQYSSPYVEIWERQFLPEGFIYGTYWASAAEPRLSTQIVNVSGDQTFVESTMGGRLGLFRFGPHDTPEGFQFDLVGGAKLRQNWGDLDVIATDYRYDLLGTYGDGPHRYKFGFYHVSSHLGDEFLLNNVGFDRLNYFRDAFVFGYSYYAFPELRLYAETSWSFHNELSEPWEFQFGFDYGPTCPTGPQGKPFVAFNTHLREEVNFGGNVALQFGWAWKGDSPTAGTLRTGLYYYNGESPQFSFYDEHEQQIGAGLWYDY